MGVCCWCRRVCKLVDGKPYCHACKVDCFRECIRCHRPFPNEKYFSMSHDRCNACSKKYLKEKSCDEAKSSYLTTGPSIMAKAKEDQEFSSDTEMSAVMSAGSSSPGPSSTTTIKPTGKNASCKRKLNLPEINFETSAEEDEAPIPKPKKKTKVILNAKTERKQNKSSIRKVRQRNKKHLRSMLMTY